MSQLTIEIRHSVQGFYAVLINNETDNAVVRKTSTCTNSSTALLEAYSLLEHYHQNPQSQYLSPSQMLRHYH